MIEKSQTLEELANGLFDEMGFQEGDETTFDTEAYRPNHDANIKESALGEQETNTEKPAEKPAERLYAGRFKTVEEMESFIANGGNTEAPKQLVTIESKSEEMPDLSREELITLQEGDDQDGTEWTVGYLQKKMAERNLTDFEMEKLKELDTEGKDLYGSYVAGKTKREVMAELKPTLQPLQERQSKEQYDAFVEKEKAILNTLDNEYAKDELATLKQKTSDPKFIQTVVGQSALGHIISNEFNNGSKATAYKLLLSESKAYMKKQQDQVSQGKKEKSIPADIGSKSPNKKAKAQTIEDAFNDSVEELNF